MIVNQTTWLSQYCDIWHMVA